MLSAKEIIDYIQGPTTLPPKESFTSTEAKQIGEALGIRWETFDVAQYTIGLNVELEHGRRNPTTDITHDEPMLTGKIALAHLNKTPDYYSRVAVIQHETEVVQPRPRRGSFREMHVPGGPVQ